MPIRDEIYVFLESLGLNLPDDLQDDTALFETGLFDSLALFSLMLWIEEQVGCPIDPSRLALTREWATIDDIVCYIEGRQTRDSTDGRPDHVFLSRQSRTNDYEVVKYRPKFKIQVAELQKGLWSPDSELNARYFEWKFERNPYLNDPPRVYLAFQGDDLVGMRGFWGSRWEVGSRIESLLVADDLIIRDGHRNRGVYTRMMDAAFEDLADKSFTHAFSLSASPTNVFGSLTMGWKSVGMLRPMRIQSTSARFRNRLRSTLSKGRFVWRFAGAPIFYSTAEREPFRLFDRAVTQGDQAEMDGITFQTQPRLSDMVGLIDRIPHDGRIRHVRDYEYLSWRYENPLNAYRFVYADGKQLDGYVALSRPVARSTPDGRVKIADIEARDGDVFFRLLSATIQYVQDLVIWTSMMSEAKRNGLRELGFVPVDQGRTARGCPCILVRPLLRRADWCIDGQPLLDMDAWDIRMLYSMSA